PRHHLSGGTPPGHPPIRCYMGIPMFFGGELVGVAGIANREGGYSEDTARFLEPFISACATVIHAFRKDREQAAAMRALRESDERFRKLAENIREVFWIASLDGKTLEYVSPAYEDIWGRSSDTLYRNPRRWLKTVARGDRREILERLRLETGGDWKRIEFPSVRITRPDGTLRWIQVHVYPVRDRGGSTRLMAGIAEDITESRKVEEERALLREQLHQAQKMEAIGQLAGGVAHDFNNILTATIGCSQLLLKKLPPVSTLRSHVEMILSSGRKAAGLTQSLLAFSRKQNIELMPVNANEVIAKVARLLSRLIGEDIDLSLELSSGPLTINADSLQLEQVLMNLAVNARDAMPRGGAITLRTDRIHLEKELINAYCRGEPGYYAVISFSDTGTGIPPAILDRIFEPFFTTKEAGKGTGLGLSIVLGIVQQHGGCIGVDSTPGQGTTFRIYLPIAEGEIGSTPEPEQYDSQAGNGTILIAEDDAAVRVLLRMILEENGYVCIEADDGWKTVECFRQRSREIDLVILDVVLPRMNGGSAFTEMRKIRSDVRVLFISGYTHDLINQKGVLDDGVKVVSKPLTPTELLRHVQEILRS
ncbi:MAG: response regulator, partial [Geobacteraceae bacterium]|nr:response regulator [Geobacteraceae bacterium]